ncbi:MAG TPA: hypothetical protein VNU26_06440, partial [Mycobacteriales bacterium]|nr:hypothetical protein [Mycobacteriales bacterium]
VPSRRAAVAAASVLVAGFAVHQATSAYANHTPADKPFAAASKTLRSGPTPRIELLSATVKNSKPTDMVLQVSLECGLITDTILLGSSTPGAQDSTRATGTVRAWIEVDGKIVPIISSSAPPRPPLDATEHVVTWALLRGKVRVAPATAGVCAIPPTYGQGGSAR